MGLDALVKRLMLASGLNPVVLHGPTRAGNVGENLADIGAARKAFGFGPVVTMDEGLPDYIRGARTEMAS